MSINLNGPIPAKIVDNMENMRREILDAGGNVIDYVERNLLEFELVRARLTPMMRAPWGKYTTHEIEEIKA